MWAKIATPACVHCFPVPAPSQPNVTTPALAPCRSCGRVYPAAKNAMPVDNTMKGRLLGGKFQLDRVGDGGMASVWQATNTLVHRSVAIKQCTRATPATPSC